jgi:Ser/Thr protein kinase RdoA (MazF antagonist)
MYLEQYERTACLAMTHLALNEKTLLIALVAWNLSSPITVERLPGGFTSDVWLVETSNGRFIAKYSEQSQQAFEGGLRAAGVAEQAGVRSGSPLATKKGALSILVEGVHGAQQPLALLQYVPGDPLQFSEPDAASLYGHLLGRTHCLLLHAFAEGGLLDLETFLLQEADYVTAQPGLGPLIYQALEKMRAYEAHHLVTVGVIWADRLEIVREKATGQVGIIDWGAIERGPLAFDVALSLLWLFPEGTQAAQEFLHAYLAVAPISIQELAGLPYYKALFWARQAKYFAYRMAAGVTFGNGGPEGNVRHFAEARAQLENLLATL